MPTAPKKPCRKQPCSGFRTHGSFCEIHQKQEDKQYVESRKSEPWWKWLHSRRWRNAAKAHKAEFPLCAECERNGRTTAAYIVHHIEPHKGDYELFWNPLNWESICSEHHEAIHKHERFKKRG